MRNLLSEKLLKDLNKGIRMFGTYNFGDKGVDEVMDIAKYEKAMAELPLKEFMQVVCDLLEDENGKEFATDFCENSEFNFIEMKKIIITEGIKIEDGTFFSDIQPTPVRVGLSSFKDAFGEDK